MKMKVLVACEFSGVVRDAFIAKGHDAWSCDLLPSNNSNKHIVGDALQVLNQDWDLLIAHPPCTYLTVAGARWFYHPEDRHLPKDQRRPHPDYPTRKQDQIDAINFFMAFANANIEKIAIENPIGVMSSAYRKPDQIIQPWQFGHDAAKSTCLWLKNLPILKPTKTIQPRIVNGKKRWANQTDSGQNKLTPSEDRWKLRSVTYQGIADAMADQWG